MKRRQYNVVIIAMLCIGMSVHSAKALSIDESRSRYQEAKKLLKDKNLEQYEVIRASLKDYSLAQYLDYQRFKIDLRSKTPDEVRTFKFDNQTLPVGNTLSYDYLVVLGLNERWSEFLDYFPQEPSSSNLQCYYYQAKNKTGQKDLAWKGAEKLWLTGHTVTYECDDLFSDWFKSGNLTDDLIIERMLLAYQIRNTKLFSYLEKMLTSEESKAKSKNIMAILDNFDELVSFSNTNQSTDFTKKIAEIALKNAAKTHPEKVIEVLPTIINKQRYATDKKLEIIHHIVSSIMSTDSKKLAQWRDSQLENYPKDSFIERRIRVAIRAADWPDVSKWINYLSPSEKSSSRWQFWSAQIDSKNGDQAKAEEKLQRLLGKRNFYSVAAANVLNEPIQYSMNMPPKDINVVKGKYQIEFARINELLAIDEPVAAKNEWEYLLNRVSKKEIKELASYASQQQWHHFAILATIKGEMWSYLTLRFPMAHQRWFKHYSKQLELDKITLLSLSRQESALNAEARSPVGARGLMQIMPATAKDTANKINYERYQNVDNLNEIDINIHIGSNYFKELLDKNDGNRIFALASYNAGPHRVKTWRSVSNEKLDAYAFIEAIPFRETRTYVQNILMFELYYRNLFGENGSFLSEKEQNLKY